MPPTMLLNSLQTVRKRVKLLGVLYGIGVVAAGTIALILSVILVDYLIHLYPTPRLAILLGLIAAVCYGLYRWVGRPLVAKLSLSDVAGRLEQAFPQFNDRLRSTVDFVQSDIPGSELMKKRVVGETTDLASRLDLSRAVVATPAWYSMGAGLGAILLAIMLAMLSPGSASIALSRLLSPFGAIEWPKRVQIDMAKELPSRVPVGQRIDVRMKLSRGDSPSRKASIFYQYDDGPVQRELMVRGTDGTYGASLDARVDAGKNAANLKIWMESGDDEKRLAPITVVPRLTIKTVEAELTPPPYVTEQPVTTVNLVAAPALVADGSRVTLKIGFSKSLAMGSSIEVVPASEEMARPDVQWQPMASAASQLNITGSWVARQSLRFHIRATDQDGFTNSALEEYEVIVRPDQNPAVQIEYPRKNEERAVSSIVPLMGLAEDDYGIQSLKLVVERPADKKRWDTELLNNSAATNGATASRAEGAADRLRLRVNYQWELGKLAGADLKPGDLLEYHLLVKDNFALDNQTHPEVASGRLRITIVSDEDLAARIVDELRQIRTQVQNVRTGVDRTRQETQTLRQDTQNRQQLDAADQAALERLTNQQATSTSQTMQLAQRVQALRDRLAENRTQNQQELENLARDVANDLQQAAENPLRQATNQLSNLARQTNAQRMASAQQQNANANPQQGQQEQQNGNDQQQQAAQQQGAERMASAQSNAAQQRNAAQQDANNQQTAQQQNQQQQNQDGQPLTDAQRQQQDGQQPGNNQQQGQQQNASAQQQPNAAGQRSNAPQQQNSAQQNASVNQQQSGQQQQGQQQQGQQQNASAQQQGQQQSGQQQGQQSRGQQQNATANRQQSGQQQAGQQQQGQQGQQQSGQQQQGQQGQQQSGQQQQGQQQSASAQQQQGQQQQGQQQQGQRQQPQQQQQQGPIAQQREQALAQTMENQQQASTDLQRALDRMNSIGSMQETLNRLRDLLQQQQQVSQETRQIGRESIGQTPEQMNQQQRQRLNENADQQQRLAEQTQRQLEEMQRQSQQMQRSDQSASQAMQRAAQQGQQQQTSQNQQRASQQTRQNQQAQAQMAQRQAEIGLQRMVDELQEAERHRLAQLQKQLEELEDQINNLIHRQAGHNLDNLALQGPEKLAQLDLTMIGELMAKAERDQANLPAIPQAAQLSGAQEQTEHNTRDLGKAAETMPNGTEPAAHLTRAASRMERAIVNLRDKKFADAYDPSQVDALNELEAAIKQVDEQRQQAEQQAQEQQKEAVRQRYVKIKADQQKINDETVKIDKSRAQDGALGRAEGVRLGQMPAEQGKLSDQINEINDELVAIDSTVYVWANKDIMNSMNDVKDDLGKQTTGVPTQSEQTRIVEQLDAMIRNLAIRPRTSRFAQDAEGQDQQDQQQGQGQQGQAGQRRQRLPSEAELRLLQDLQRAVNKSTKTIDEQPQKDKPKLLALGGRQGDLRDLLDKMLQAASRGQMKLAPEPDNRDQLPEEAKAEQVENQELEQDLLKGAPDAARDEKQANLIGARMGRSRQRLALNNDPGKITQLIQDRIILDFDSLIQQAQQQEAQTRNSRQQQQQRQQQQRQQQQRNAQAMQQPRQNQQQQQGQQQQQNQQNGNNAAAASRAPTESAQTLDQSKQIQETGQEWGSVSPRLRDAVMERKGEEAIEDYRKFIDEYFRSVSAKTSGQQ